MITMKVPVDKIADVIGKQGSVIKQIVADTGAKVDIEEDGSVFISGVDKTSLEAARAMIEAIIFEPVVGEIYEGVVTRIIPIGAFVEFAPKKEGMVHISKLDKKRTEKVEDVCNVGDTIKVKFLGVDEKGRFNLSRKDALED